MKIGKLTFEPISVHHELVAGPVWRAANEHNLLDDIFVSSIDPKLADTEAFCSQYDVGLDISANCVIVQARRAERTWYAACIILATNWVDVNKTVKKHLDARKISFAPMETAVELTNMEYGGITPIGLPDDWPILVDEAVTSQKRIIIGSGIRASKIAVESSVLTRLPNSTVMDIQKH